MSQFVFKNRENQFFSLKLPLMSETSAITGALGSIIGYLGSEVAEPAVFERLLWPERFYNVISCRNAIEMTLFMPLGGPVHKAALQTLVIFEGKACMKVPCKAICLEQPSIQTRGYPISCTATMATTEIGK